MFEPKLFHSVPNFMTIPMDIVVARAEVSEWVWDRMKSQARSGTYDKIAMLIADAMVKQGHITFSERNKDPGNDYDSGAQYIEGKAIVGLSGGKEMPFEGDLRGRVEGAVNHYLDHYRHSPIQPSILSLLVYEAVFDVLAGLDVIVPERRL